MAKFSLNIPAHWKETKIGELGAISSGGTPSTRIAEYFDGDIPWITPADLTGYKAKYISKGHRNITDLGLQKSSAKLLVKGTVLFSSRAPIGYVAIAANDLCTNQGFKNLTPSEVIFNEYLYYYLKAAKDITVDLASGTTFKEISANGFSRIPVPLPPLYEQHRIVARIEELFSDLDDGIASLKKAREQLKVYRQSMLKWAFEGRLTNEDVKDGELPEGWRITQLGNICEKASKVRKDMVDISSSFVYVDIGSIDNRTNKIVSYKVYKWKDAPSRAQQIIMKDDILFSTVRTYLKNIALVDNVKYSGQIGSTGFTVIRTKSNVMMPSYLFYYVTSDAFIQSLNVLQTGSSYPAVRDSDVWSQYVPVPPINEQIRIVQEIESRFSVADNLEQSINESLQQAEALRQSILKRAFEGKLVNNE